MCRVTVSANAPKMVLAEEKSRRVQAVYYNGDNFFSDITDFVGEEKWILRSLEPDSFIVKDPLSAKCYLCTRDHFILGHEIDGFDFSHPSLKPQFFMTKPKFVHCFKFKEDHFDEATEFVKKQGIEGVELYAESPFGDYKITNLDPEQCDFVVHDNDIIINDFQSIYPINLDEFRNKYDIIGEEIDTNVGFYDDSYTVFFTNAKDKGGIHAGFMIETEDHQFFGIHFQEGKPGEDGYYPGISEGALLRILYCRMKEKAINSSDLIGKICQAGAYGFIYGL